MKKFWRKMLSAVLAAVMMLSAATAVFAYEEFIPVEVFPISTTFDGLDIEPISEATDGVMLVEVPAEEGATQTSIDIAIDELEENEGLNISSFGIEVMIPADMLENLSEKVAAIRFTFEEGKFSFMLLDADGKEYVWRDSANVVSVSVPYRLPMDISSHQVVLRHAEVGAVARSYYADGKVYAELMQSGAYRISVESLGGYTDTIQKWMHTAAAYMTARGVASGEDGLFKPSEQITREEFHMMLFKTLGTADTLEEEDDSELITRQEMMFLTHSTMQVCDMLPEAMTMEWIVFDDWDDTVLGEYANAIQMLCKLKIIGGTGNGQISANRIVTRAEAAQMLYNLLMYDKK